ncbi:hypothetical protein Dsin_021266 [Dipteronia sinensis]|uniref:Uncharacterized protein n=1 Tax=Dipteronia sinensis TaxID=43782 RepID=A0AAE0A0M1_9ROSI|nr:hypothetical protein Dsin_021266 [Dipteronia sinensis]
MRNDESEMLMVEQWREKMNWVYKEIQVEGYIVDYERVPVIDEKSPKEMEFDILVDKISQADINTEVIFNSKMGRGRTTTRMVIAMLIYLNRIGSSGISRTNSVGRVYDSNSNVTDNLPNPEEAIRRGEYPVIRSLIQVLEGGVEGKRQVDEVIDKCSSMQMKREASLSFFVEYLERFYFLICFAVYIQSERAALCSNSFGHSSFADRMKARSGLYSIIRRLLRRNPMWALGDASSKPSLIKIAESANACPQEMGVIAALRNGQVLGSQTVLKRDHSPDCQSPTLPVKLEGAPNFS